MKEFLSRNGLDYKEVDINKNPEAINELVSLTGEMRIPVVRKDDNYVIGYDEHKLKKLINM
ncbi:glutaredoxin family protein [Natranaerobius trueperi]|uniref:Glutaredoxin domain-containing protein n=1 Tax=Natranaerobius trueperi TaxID=759412 RepID=A0A226BZK4_9FIRM|nr:glutaredoxin family protein [Natranaerobius trueperi]OWZ83764.1 hypothetical protein CDO51_06630 [Natranaerobius trueperi]